ncbi:MAG: DNA-3-methyladenine glycosylase, partial [Actinomycetota bacterium]
AVTGEKGEASAVLLRAIEPTWNVEAMRRGAPTNLPDHLVGSGPGRICRALDIDRRLNGADLVEGTIRILPAGTSHSGDVGTGIRVGLTKDDERHWRFFTDSRSVSRSPRPGRGS